MSTRIGEETVTKAVYGKTFAEYNRDEFLEFLHPVEVRLEANGIAMDVFKGKKCLDAGCGGGIVAPSSWHVLGRERSLVLI